MGKFFSPRQHLWSVPQKLSRQVLCSSDTFCVLLRYAELFLSLEKLNCSERSALAPRKNVSPVFDGVVNLILKCVLPSNNMTYQEGQTLGVLHNQKPGGSQGLSGNTDTMARLFLPPIEPSIKSSLRYINQLFRNVLLHKH